MATATTSANAERSRTEGGVSGAAPGASSSRRSGLSCDSNSPMATARAILADVYFASMLPLLHCCRRVLRLDVTIASLFRRWGMFCASNAMLVIVSAILSAVYGYLHFATTDVTFRIFGAALAGTEQVCGLIFVLIANSNTDG